jgi:hypothetical protein
MSFDSAAAKRPVNPVSPFDSTATGASAPPKGSRSRTRSAFARISREILRTELEIMTCDRELDSLVAGDDVALGELLRLRTTRLELEAYLRGLHFALSR